jgi:hypothetical protein
MLQTCKIKHPLTGCCIVVLFFSLFSCSNETKVLTQQQSTAIRDSVQHMMNMLSKDISNNGPIAWLTWFEKTPDFFMASEGHLVFPNSDSATLFIKHVLVKQIRTIQLQWSNMRIDPLTTHFSGIAATWHEEITDFASGKISQEGYFTAIAEKTAKGWQLRNAHWSTKK